MHFFQRCSSLLIPSKQKPSSFSPKYISTASMTPSLRQKSYRGGSISDLETDRSDGAESGEYGELGRTSKLHLVAAVIIL